MTYLPPSFNGVPLEQVVTERLSHVSGQVLAREVLVADATFLDEALVLLLDGSPRPAAIERNRVLQFGKARATAEEYFRRVIERGDRIDLITSRELRPTSDTVRLDTFWIHIVYAEPSSSAPRPFQKKDDGHFAMNAKSGEKAERLVTRRLRDDGQHPFTADLIHTPGFFEIRYSGKGARTVDRVCPQCKLKVEVKKRNKDRYYRVSHSERRPFWEDNDKDGWQAFVFPDMSSAFVSNAQIIQAIRNGDFRPGADTYDEWADIAPRVIGTGTPPGCS
jgi:hypothetical protein